MKNIIIADDNPDIRFSVEDSLRLLGYDYNFLKASDGHQCIDLMKAGDVDLVILDIAMPKMDGWQTYSHISSEGSTPVIFLTALNEEYVKERADKLGASLMTKPFVPEELADEIKRKLV